MERVPEIYNPEEPEYPECDEPEGCPEPWQGPLLDTGAAIANNLASVATTLHAILLELRALREAKR